MRATLISGTILFALGLACAGVGSPPEPSTTEPPTAEPEEGEVEPAAADLVQLEVVSAVDETGVLAGAYAPWKAVDGKQGSTWVVKDSALSVFVVEGQVQRLDLVPGFALDARRWAKNRRPTKIKVRRVYSGGGRKREAEPWATFELAPPAELPSDPWVSVDLGPQTLKTANRVDIEVLEATPKPPGGDDDICISEVRLFGSRESAPQIGGPWVYGPEMYTDRLAADFDMIDLEKCDISHDGTGGGPPAEWRGTCERVEGGVHLKGQRVSACFGRPELSEEMDFCDPEEAVDVDRVVPIHEVGPCMAVIDGHPFTRRGC